MAFGNGVWPFDGRGGGHHHGRLFPGSDMSMSVDEFGFPPPRYRRREPLFFDEPFRSSSLEDFHNQSLHDFFQRSYPAFDKHHQRAQTEPRKSPVRDDHSSKRAKEFVNMPIHFKEEREDEQVPNNSNLFTKGTKPNCHCNDCRVGRQVNNIGLSPRVNRRTMNPSKQLFESVELKPIHNQNWDAPLAGDIHQANANITSHPCENLTANLPPKQESSVKMNIDPSSQYDIEDECADRLLRESNKLFERLGINPEGKLVNQSSDLENNQEGPHENDNAMSGQGLDTSNEKDIAQEKLEQASISSKILSGTTEDKSPPMDNKCEITSQKLKAIEGVRGDVLGLQERVNLFAENTKNLEYLTCEELLTKCLLKLDDILTDGIDEVRKARKALVLQINSALKQLEEKVDKDR